ncbi:MAG TPA: peptidase T [Candidatus Marinimicrobia bacterium]|nr:peptidase T [Candidatus Neomarinimicrobiota bacterium]HPN74120.1 peptidase T [Candidatus Neomarinimicrobiota bacterium]HQO74536.1 peptidase T [Candidatus Neomarinimicrobiota bacterium]HQQ84455.1 peptidase T [Candidatus Neomarinimicrobiota bacterium]
MDKEILEHFFRYVKIDTQSQEDVTDRYPSTAKQLDLAKILVKELIDLGLKDAAMDEFGIVMATLPSNLAPTEAARIPVIGLIAHLDTSPEVSGKDVKPIIHQNYRGGDIKLPGDPNVIIRQSENPILAEKIGEDIVTSDGTTLLGADDKAGIAEIMSFLSYLQKHPDIKHGTLRIAFTPDEEVGAGTDHFDVKKFGADFAYTVDGETVGEIEIETFNASAGIFTVHGINVHPGYAKGKMVNAIPIAAEIVRLIDREPSPATTEKREGYLHPYVIEGGVEKVTLRVLLRDFDADGIRAKTVRLNEIRDQVASQFPLARVELEVKESYKNMYVKLAENPKVIEYALEATRRAGIQPKTQIIRGGTDGAKLCFMGLPTPNIFTGGHNFHSKQEWISVQDMEKTVATLVNLVQVWVEKSL